MEEAKTLFRPKLWVALTSMAFLIAAMCCAIFLTGQQLHITMMTCLGFTILLLVLTGCPYATIEEAILHGGKLLIPTLVILYCIGALMGSWIASGTVPMRLQKFWKALTATSLSTTRFFPGIRDGIASARWRKFLPKAISSLCTCR